MESATQASIMVLSVTNNRVYMVCLHGVLDQRVPVDHGYQIQRMTRPRRSPRPPGSGAAFWLLKQGDRAIATRASKGPRLDPSAAEAPTHRATTAGSSSARMQCHHPVHRRRRLPRCCSGERPADPRNRSRSYARRADSHLQGESNNRHKFWATSTDSHWTYRIPTEFVRELLQLITPLKNADSHWTYRIPTEFVRELLQLTTPPDMLSTNIHTVFRP